MKKRFFLTSCLALSMLFFSFFQSTTSVEAQEISTDFCIVKGHWEHLPIPGRPVAIVCDNSGNAFCARPCETITITNSD